VNVDPDIAVMMDFEALAGNLEQSLGDPTRIALSEGQARKYFDSTDVVGQELEVLSAVSQTGSLRESYRVGAVYRMSGKSDLDLPAMSLLRESAFDVPTFHNWVILDLTTLIQLKSGIGSDSLSSRLG